MLENDPKNVSTQMSLLEWFSKVGIQFWQWPYWRKASCCNCVRSPTYLLAKWWCWFVSFPPMGPKKKKKFFQTWFCCQVSTLLGLRTRRSGRDYRRTFIILWGLFSCRIDQLVEALTCTHLHWDHTSATQETAQLLSSLCLTPLSTIQQLCNGREREN